MLVAGAVGNNMCYQKTVDYPTIKALVLDFVHRCAGHIDYGTLAAEVLTRFPDLRTHTISGNADILRPHRTVHRPVR